MTLIQETQAALQECKEVQEQYNCFVHILEEQAIAQAQKIQERLDAGQELPLAGLMLTVKDNLCVKGVEITAGSQILDGYIPQYDATVLKRLTEHGAIILAITAMDEFGFGSFNTNVGLNREIPKNPNDTSKVTGGSSGGSAAATRALSFRHLSVAESTGGSIETPAAYCGVIGYCPTYGLLSRHGVISYADSLDKIGFMATSVTDIQHALEKSTGLDANDRTVIYEHANTPSEIKTIGILRADVDATVQEEFDAFVQRLQQRYHVIEITLPTTQTYALAAYYTLAMSEASTNLAAYSGLRYGVQTDPKGADVATYMSSIRAENFGSEAKKRLILGTYMRSAGYRDQYYLKAKNIQEAIKHEYHKQFEKVDLIISPTAPTTPPSFEQVKDSSSTEAFETDRFTVGPNMAGIPHASIPISDTHQVGALICAGCCEDQTLLKFIQEVLE